MKNYIKSETYYTLYAYSATGERVKIETFVSFTKAKMKASEYKDWQIEVTYYITSLPF